MLPMAFCLIALAGVLHGADETQSLPKCAAGCSVAGPPTAELGAGEILLNCIDKDGTNSGFDIELINAVKGAVTIPVIASSGAGSAEHFREVFTETKAESALAAGIFHRREVPISEVKKYLSGKVEIRIN